MVKKTLTFYEGIGRRKSSTARVRLYLTSGKELSVRNYKIKKGDFVVNSKKVADYFALSQAQSRYELPLKLTDSLTRFGISVVVTGGGKMGQLDALVLGLARALQKADESLRPSLKAAGLLTRDARIRERRKPGTGGRARRKKQSPKR